MRWQLPQCIQQEPTVGGAIERNRAAAGLDNGQCIEASLCHKDRFIAGRIEGLPVEKSGRSTSIVYRPAPRLCIRVDASRDEMEMIRWNDNSRAAAVTFCRSARGS